jgi:TRAP transporter 4TM/12TM fusion protein
MKQEKTQLQNMSLTAMKVLAVMMALYHLISTQYILVDSIVYRVIHIGFAMAILLLGWVYASKGARKNWIAFIFVLVSIVVTVYMSVNAEDIKTRVLFPTTLDTIIGVVALVVAFVTGILAFGNTLAVVTVVLIAYAIFGQYLPGAFNTPSLLLKDQILPYLTTGLGTGWGIYGSDVAISANYIFLLVFFGSVLEACGGTRFIIQLGNIIGMKMRSGPAAVAVIGSSLLGTVTGSTAANISICGSYTIPMMKKVGYTPETAAAIEAASSNGGQVMPPVLGAAAFVMAGFTGIAYANIMVASVIPALMYYVVLILFVQFQASKLNISKLSEVAKIETPPKSEMLWDAPIFLVPLVVLAFMLLSGFSLAYTGFWATISVILMSLIRKKTRPSFSKILNGFVNGAVAASAIAVSCAMIGMIDTAISVTGLGAKLPSLISTFSGGLLPIALLISMVVSIILGMGVPTVAAYLLVAIIGAPVLVKMGVPLLQAHYFAFFYSTFSHLTPPVALGAMVAAKIAQAKYWPTCIQALKAAATAFIIPWLGIYVPVVLLQPSVSVISAAMGIISSFFGVMAMQVVLSRFLFFELDLKEWAVCALGTVALFYGAFSSNSLSTGGFIIPIIIGIVLLALAFLSQWRKFQASKQTQAPSAT